MFTSSCPVWAKDRQNEMNLFLEFLTGLPAGSETVRLTASTAYQLFADGECIAYGPARAGDGHFRVDEWNVRGVKELRVLVAGYAACSFQYTFHPSFLNMEILDADSNALLATGRDEILCREYTAHAQRVDKYSRQRLFTESYDFTRPVGEALEVAVQPDPIYLPRGVEPFSNAILEPVAAVIEMDAFAKPFDEALLQDGESPMHRIEYLAPGMDRRMDDIECYLYKEINSIDFANFRPAEEGPLAAGTARIYSLAANSSGQIGLDCVADGETVVYFTFDEMLCYGDMNPDRDSMRNDVVNAVKVVLPAGEHRFLCFEPYTFKYLKVTVMQGTLTMNRLYMLEQAGAKTLEKKFADPRLQRVYDAACNTFRQNATDIFMDCPSRERAGWLCDSFFTSRSEYALTGGSKVETNFLENFWRCTGFRMASNAPEGFVPMLHPGDTDYIRDYIINWNQWLILELEEYAFKRGGKPEIVAGLKDIVYGILGGLERLENEYGLVEDMPGWVFVEWSRANDKDVICGVNFPTNMLYCGALEAAARTYGDAALMEKAAKLREVIRGMAFNGEYFVDNAVRVDGKLVLTQTTTEVCQYYAFFFGVATKELHPGLWDTFLHKFGPKRKANNPCPDVPFANAFIGNYLRLDILMREGLYAQLLDEIADYFDYMAQQTGTLWENDHSSASCCHGFASHAAVWLLGMYDELSLGKA